MTDDKQVQKIARVVHEANRAWQIECGDPVSPPWDEAPAWMQHSARAGVRTALEGATPEELHDEWVAERGSEGWTWGPFKVDELKKHPSMVHFSELPAKEQAKDIMFHAIVNALYVRETHPPR